MKHLAAALLLLAACGAPEVSAPARSRQALTTSNGSDLNGSDLNGSDLNGTDLSNFLVSVDYAGISINGTALDGVHLEGTTLVGSAGGVSYSGTDFVQAELTGNLGSGASLRLRIKAMQPADAPNADLWLYDVEFRDAANTGWYPICPDGSGGHYLATAVDGAWDYTQGTATGGSKLTTPGLFTFACQHGAIYKCVVWGYRPWASVNGVSLAPYHQACTRLVRADFCGDGRSYTVNGTLINLYDDLGVQQDTEDWVFEASWDENGATCFSPLNRSHAGVPCYDAKLSLSCGPNAMMSDETPTAGLTNSPLGPF